MVFTWCFPCNCGQMLGGAAVIWRCAGSGHTSVSCGWQLMPAEALAGAVPLSNDIACPCDNLDFAKHGDQVLRRYSHEWAFEGERWKASYTFVLEARQHDLHCTCLVGVDYRRECMLRGVLHGGRLATTRENSYSVIFIVPYFTIKQTLLMLVFLQPFLV